MGTRGSPECSAWCLFATFVLLGGLSPGAGGGTDRGQLVSPWVVTGAAAGEYSLGADARPGPGTAPAGACGLPEWLSLAGYVDAGYRSTNFFEPDYDTSLVLGDGRVEFWLPPGRDRFSWGPYIRIAGIDGDRPEAWENAWLALPGLGLHAFPFSYGKLRGHTGWLGRMLGPLRLFGEYNRQDYGEDENRWRPDEQTRAGADYWLALGVNDVAKPWWAEVWSGLFWQSANEFDAHYDSVILGNAVRTGVRAPNAGVLSWFTPYVLLESSLTDNEDYYWENRLTAGVGVRLAPRLEVKPRACNWLTRLVVYAEYLEVQEYYHEEAPSGVPDHDFRAGISVALGDWYRTP